MHSMPPFSPFHKHMHLPICHYHPVSLKMVGKKAITVLLAVAYVHDKSKQGKYIHPEQLSLFSKKKLPWVGFEPTTLRVLGERSTS